MRSSIFRNFPVIIVALTVLFACSSPDLTQILLTGKLPAPDTTGGKPLMEALRSRHTTREFSAREFSPQVLSNLLWAADGINRKDGKRTAANAFNSQAIDIYVVLRQGVYRYDAKAVLLLPVLSEDIRALTGGQGAKAPLTLLYVSEQSRYPADQNEERRAMWSYYDTGFIGQNVYLFCASEGLAAVVRATDSEALAKKLGLTPSQRVTLAQSVGYPK